MAGDKILFQLLFPPKNRPDPRAEAHPVDNGEEIHTSETDTEYDSFTPKERTQYSYQIFIKHLTGSLDPIEVEPEDTVGVVKKKFYYKSGLKNPRFVYAGKNLEDNFPLSKYNIQKEAIIHCISRVD